MQINLLAPKSVHVRKKKSEVDAALPLVALVFVVISLVAAIGVQVMSYSVNQDIAETKTEILNLGKLEEQIKLRQLYQANFTQLQKAQETILAMKPTHTKQLDALAQVMPSAIVVKQITLDGQPWVMRVAGSAPNHQVVAQMGMQLHNQPMLSKAEIVTSKKKDKFYEFEITIQGGVK